MLCFDVLMLYLWQAEDDEEGFLRLMDDTPEDQKLPLLLLSTLRVYHDQVRNHAQTAN